MSGKRRADTIQSPHDLYDRSMSSHCQPSSRITVFIPSEAAIRSSDSTAPAVTSLWKLYHVEYTGS